MKPSNFSKTVYNFYKIYRSHSAPEGAPVCAVTSKSYDWPLRNIAKVSPKMDQNTTIFGLFDFQKLYAIRAKFSTLILHHIRILCVQ